MKKYRFLTAAFLIIFIGGGCFHSLRELRSKATDIQKETEALTVVLPDAQNFSKKDGAPLHYKAYKTSAQTTRDLAGLAFMTTDITPEIRGYAGPIKILVGMTPEGSIAKAHVISHSETPSYVFELDTFLDQFTTKNIKNVFQLGQDIDGISRATITSEAVARAVDKSLKQVAGEVLRLETASITVKEKPLPLEEIVVPLALFIIAIIGILSRKHIIRWMALVGGFLYFGIIKSTMVSVVQIANICLLKFPSFGQSPLWYMLIGLTLLTTLFLGMVFCGSLCPFAAVQEVLYNTAHRKKKPKEHPPSYTVDQRGRYVKHFILGLTIIVSVILGNASAASIEPFLTLFTLKATILGWSLLLFTLLAAIFYFRFWCKYLCPVGACLGLLARISPFKIKLGKDCTHCAVCNKVCPTRAIYMDAQELPVIDYPECILCGKCIDICPKETLSFRGFSHEKGE